MTPEELSNLVSTSVRASLAEAGVPVPDEIIDQAELARRLGVTVKTIRNHSRRIPSIRIGSAVRYNWSDVVKVWKKGGK